MLPKPAKILSGLPTNWLNPASPTFSPETLFLSLTVLSFSSLHVSLSTLHYLTGGLFPWQTFTPLASKINLWGNIPWVFLGLLGVHLSGPGSGYHYLQKRHWCSARGLGPTSRLPAATGCWLLPGHMATPHQGKLYRNRGLCGPSTPWALPPPRHIPPWCHHQPCRSVMGAAQVKGGYRVTGSRLLHITVLSLLQPRAPTWAKSCLSPGAMLWMLELEQLCVWQWCILMPQV